MQTETLGEIVAPSGKLLVVDPGYLGWWCHDQDPGPDPPPPVSEDIGEIVDIQIEGRDAEAAGKAYDRQWHPRFLFDIPRKHFGSTREHFQKEIGKHEYLASLSILPQRVTHLRRVDLALEHGRGAGEMQMHGMWIPVFGGLPSRPLPVTGERFQTGPDEGRWRRIIIVVSDGVVAESRLAGRVMVDAARLILADADALGGWVHDEPLDGLVDFVFWGKDAAEVAAATKAPRISGEQYGWKGLTEDEIAAHAADVRKMKESGKLKFACDFRPHSHYYLLNDQIRTTSTESGVVTIASAKFCGFSTSWGDGIFPVHADFAADGSLLKIRLELGCDEIVERQRKFEERWVGIFAKYALVSKQVTKDGKPVCWLFREQTDRENDSGWRIFAGDEQQEYLDNADNIDLVPLRDLISKDKSLEEIFRTPTGSAFERDGANGAFRLVDWRPSED